MTNSKKNTTKIGNTGEKLVSLWLESQDWTILNHHWHCRWGEIDLIAQKKSTNYLAFVEVKTRSQNNWDDDGLLAIDIKKQLKISRTAATFLTNNSIFSECFCRFDVALVNYQKQRYGDRQLKQKAAELIESGYQFTLSQYLESAFELSNNCN
jgi:putative endonuclease